MFLNTFLIHTNLKPLRLQPAPLTRRPALKKAPETSSHLFPVSSLSFWISMHAHFLLPQIKHNLHRKQENTSQNPRYFLPRQAST